MLGCCQLVKCSSIFGSDMLEIREHGLALPSSGKYQYIIFLIFGVLRYSHMWYLQIEQVDFLSVDF